MANEILQDREASGNITFPSREKGKGSGGVAISGRGMSRDFENVSVSLPLGFRVDDQTRSWDSRVNRYRCEALRARIDLKRLSDGDKSKTGMAKSLSADRFEPFTCSSLSAASVCVLLSQR
jgi:hypothetical protein